MLLIHTPEPRWLYTTYLDGNAQADTTNHGRSDQAVLLYAAARYALRRAALGRPEIDSGGFGENLAVDGLTEKTACIGYPCWKIDRRWGITGLRTRVAEVDGPPPQVIIVGVEEWEDRSGVITREAEVILLAGGDGSPCAKGHAGPQRPPTGCRDRHASPRRAGLAHQTSMGCIAQYPVALVEVSARR